MNNSKPYDHLSQDHLAAVNRKRRIVVNHPADGINYATMVGIDIPYIMEYEFGFTDENGSQIDGQWWCLDDIFPMKTRPLVNKLDYPLRPAGKAQSKFVSHPPIADLDDNDRAKVFQEWADNGINIARIYLDETKKRGLECFYSYRLSLINDVTVSHRINAQTHPEWFIKGEFDNDILDFSIPEVRDFQRSILLELVDDYDFDGLEIDFARSPQLTSAGNQWEKREMITEFIESIRSSTLELETKKNRPILLAARVPDNLLGCHFDGLDIESWISNNLVDILVLGVRSLELEIEQFKYLINNKPIKLLATLDDHHTSDGYSWPGIEVMRGLASNWWHQGIDGIQTFNWGVASPELAQKLNFWVAQAYIDGAPSILVNQQAYHELGSTETLKHKNKTFVIQRRGTGGSGGAPVNDWSTPRFSYQNTNMLGQLPAPLDNHGKVDTLLKLRVGDEFQNDLESIKSMDLKILFSDPSTEGINDNETIDQAMISEFWGMPKLFTSPPKNNIAEVIEVRINNCLLPKPKINNGWLVFTTNPIYLAVGENLVSVLIHGRKISDPEISIEKVELHVKYSK